MLPQFGGACYIKVNKGDTFGVIDIIASSQFIETGGVHKHADDSHCDHDDDWVEEWYKKRNKLHRKFTVKALENSELLTISLAVLN